MDTVQKNPKITVNRISIKLYFTAVKILIIPNKSFRKVNTVYKRSVTIK